jgi:hypothetical protein
MLTALRRRRTWAILASVGAHLGVLTAVLLQHPTLVIPVESAGPPEPIIPVLIMPRTPPPAAGQGVRPAPIQLHQRSLRVAPAETPVAPLVVAAPKAAPAPTQAPVAIAPKEPPQVPAPPDAVRNVLKTTLGCADARLSRDERAGCQERLGRGARDAPFFAQPLSAEKRAGLDQAGAAKLANRAAMERNAPTQEGLTLPSSYDGEPEVATNATPAPTYPPSKRAARVLGRLPP